MCTNSSADASATSVGGVGGAANNHQLAILAKPQVAGALLPPLDQYRLQLYNYAMAERLRFHHQHQHQHYPAGPVCPMYGAPYAPRLALSLFHHRALQPPEEPKPQHSYIGLIAMAILNSPDSKLVLSDIYQHILDNYPYFRTRGPGWRNSIRHNLSLNDCFVKAGRSANGKGHYWAVHPANVDDFRKGDFRRRKAQRKVRRHMGLAVDDEGNDSPSPPPLSVSPPPGLPPTLAPFWPPTTPTAMFLPGVVPAGVPRKRQFDVASLLAPDDARPPAKRPAATKAYNSSGDEDNAEEDIDVVASDQDDDKEASSEKESNRAHSEAAAAAANSPHPLHQYPHLLGGWGMFPGLALDQALVGRYYEQLAASHPMRRLLPSSSPNLQASDLSSNPDL